MSLQAVFGFIVIIWGLKVLFWDCMLKVLIESDSPDSLDYAYRGLIAAAAIQRPTKTDKSKTDKSKTDKSKTQTSK